MDFSPGRPVRPFLRARIAPTPSGYLHLGNIYSFVLTATLAQRHGARILLRIDDLDRQRTQRAYIQDIFDTLNFLEIPWHDGPRNADEFEREYSQVHRMELYRAALAELREKQALFACDCSRSKIQQADATGAYTGYCRTRGVPFDAVKVSWRLRTDNDAPLTVRTLGEPVVEGLPREQTDFVVRKKDGDPAYQLASVVDDEHFGVDLIVRGMDLWPSTLAQLYLARVLGRNKFMATTFYHHPLITGPGGDKLSKSAGATSIQYLRKEGKTKADVYTMIARKSGIIDRLENWLELGERL
ncbi:tRNA glutamyl-Q synthetase [Fulvivirgaceae bacterium PWU5]|uniref:tRNA glutamyl-Q synthetase n=1 Tax=Dawidia cretensis TaxID=2782350 RepID=A0AAP2E4G3_9BACT|nr:glutamate--tRNA ligase family protein [Dawidia cretensis]MBT1712435.1 tRNA glutamyl-Q synthetase [Dawidia cretensis]